MSDESKSSRPRVRADAAARARDPQVADTTATEANLELDAPARPLEGTSRAIELGARPLDGGTRATEDGVRALDFSARPTESGARPALRARDERDADARRRTLLMGGTPREILCRIVQGDPLALRTRVARRLRAEGYLFDADRVHLRTLARCARFASRYQGRPDLDEWLDQIVGEAIDDLLREDLELARRTDRGAGEPSAAFTTLAKPLGLDPVAMRRACAAFNGLGAADRKAFFQLVIEGGSLDVLARESGDGATEIARRARRALDVLLHERTPVDPQEATHEVRP